MSLAGVVGMRGSFAAVVIRRFVLFTFVWSSCLLGSLLAGSAWEHVSEHGLRQALAEHEAVLVAFILPNEPKSAALEPEWISAAAAAATAEGQGQQQHLISIDCVSSEAACRRFGVASTAPTQIQLFQQGHPVATYRGARRAEALLSFLARRSRPMVTNIHAPHELASFKTADEIVFVAFLDTDDSPFATLFSELAARYRDEFTFGLVVDGSLAEAEGILKTPTVVCYRSVDGETSTFTPALQDPDALDAWVKHASRLVLGDLTVWNRQRLLDRGWPMVYLFASTSTQRADLQSSLRRFAKSYYDSLTCVLVDPLEFPELVAQMGFEQPGVVFPAGAVHQLSKDRIYPYPQGRAFTSANVQQWGLDVYQGRVKPWTPPGVTTVYEDLAPTMVATRRVSIWSFPGVKVRVGGHGEL
ncbi:thioredoxin-like domain-containing protein [Cercophora scortea]|uniref:Protein disulfide-isomerase n=1 Tax=Cercophora scortea TaxID=314031 RepID=A0AAE0IYK9_9PEZI|nr:thioredoxin-like domain-containing protein [Cercophora scortea]